MILLLEQFWIELFPLLKIVDCFVDLMMDYSVGCSADFDCFVNH